MPPARLTVAESVMLDIIRTVAACVVAFGHLTQWPFSTGWLNLTFVARNAVSVFFVLSGFVIRYVTLQRPTTFGHYLGDRASRIYSVAIPALLFTWLTDSIARHVNPGFYSIWAHDTTSVPLRIAVNLLFCGQLWSHIVLPLTNSPYWSVNYEVIYYVGYGLFFYLAGSRRWFWLAVLCLIAGPRICYLAPLWIIGCIAHDLYQRWVAEGLAARWINWLMLVPILVLAGVILEAPLNPGLTYLTALGPVLPHLYSMMIAVNVQPPEYIFGFLWVILFMRLLLLARSFSLNNNDRFVRCVRFASEATFPVYLIHFPLLVLISACIPYNPGDPLQKLIVFLTVVFCGTLAGHPCNLLKTRIRALLFRVSVPTGTSSPFRRSSI